MYKHTMVLTYLNLKTSASFSEEHTHLTDEPLVVLDKDLLGNEVVRFDFSNKSWKYFSCILQAITDNNGEGIHLKTERAIRRRIKGTSAGIQVVYRDEEGLIWHVIVTFVESLEISNNTKVQ